MAFVTTYPLLNLKVSINDTMASGDVSCPGGDV